MEKLNMIVPSNKQKSEDLSANEFQEKLYYWLREQGLVTDLRGHLRKQMINVFQETGSVQLNRNDANFSPKSQALSTLVADHLLQQGNNYSLSIYVTEVPIIGQLFSQFSQDCVKKTLETGNRFLEKEVEDLLQTLGLIPGSDIFTQCYQMYLDSVNMKRCDSLLACIIMSLSTMNRKELDYINLRTFSRNEPINHSVSHKELISGEPKDEGWLYDMNDTVTNNLKICPITCLQEYMKSLHEEELAKVREEEARKYKKMLEEKLREFQNDDYRDRLLLEWREKLEKEYTDRENSLRLLANQLKAQHAELAQKLIFLEIESQELKQKELKIKHEQEKQSKELQVKKSEVELQKTKLNEAYERLAADKEAITSAQLNILENNETSIKTVEAQKQEIECLKHIQQQYNSLLDMMADKQKSVDRLQMKCSVAVNTSGPSSSTGNPVRTFDVQHCSMNTSPDLDNDVITRIEGEKRELIDVVTQQRQRIQELTLRAAELANQLQDAQIGLQLATPNRFAVTTPPLTGPPTVRLIPRPSWPPHIGSGEETSFAAMRQPANLMANAYTNTGVGSASHRRPISEARRRPRRVQQSKQLNSLTATSEDSATTDEMIQEARSRLRLLEQESTSVQQNYEEFRNRRNFSTTFSAMFHPDQERMRNPFDGFRPMNTSTSYPSYPVNSSNQEYFRFNNARSFASRFSRPSSSCVNNPFFVTFSRPNRCGPNYNVSKVVEDTESSDISSPDHLEPRRKSPLRPVSPLLRTKSPTDLVVAHESSPSKKLVENTLKNQTSTKSLVVAVNDNIPVKNQKFYCSKNVVLEFAKRVEINCDGRDLKNDTRSEVDKKSRHINIPDLSNTHSEVSDTISPRGKEEKCTLHRGTYDHDKVRLLKEYVNMTASDEKENDKATDKSIGETSDKSCVVQGDNKKEISIEGDTNKKNSVEVLMQRCVRTSSSTTHHLFSEADCYNTDGSDSDKPGCEDAKSSLPNSMMEVFPLQDNSSTALYQNESFYRDIMQLTTPFEELGNHTTEIGSPKENRGHALVPLLNFSSTELNSNTACETTSLQEKEDLFTQHRGLKDDFSREPGDGTEKSSLDSDDPVSAGSHGSSSSGLW